MSTNNINFTFAVNGPINREAVLAEFKTFLDSEIEYRTSGASKVRDLTEVVFAEMGTEYLDKGIVSQKVMNAITGPDPSVSEWKAANRLVAEYLPQCLIGSVKGSRLATAEQCAATRLARAMKRAENKAKKASA
jgi:hypothetical protein